MGGLCMEGGQLEGNSPFRHAVSGAAESTGCIGSGHKRYVDGVTSRAGSRLTPPQRPALYPRPTAQEPRMVPSGPFPGDSPGRWPVRCSTALSAATVWSAARLPSHPTAGHAKSGSGCAECRLPESAADDALSARGRSRWDEGRSALTPARRFGFESSKPRGRGSIGQAEQRVCEIRTCPSRGLRGCGGLRSWEHHVLGPVGQWSFNANTGFRLARARARAAGQRVSARATA